MNTNKKITHINLNEFEQYITKFKDKRILVIGDAIIDNFLYGNVTKISPDAPVPLVDVINENHFIGALGRVITYLKRFGAIVDVISCIGNDYEGEIITKYFEELGIKTDGIFKMNTFTPKISRIISRRQQLLRIEKRYTLSRDLIEKLNEFVLNYLDLAIKNTDGILILDYDLGFLKPLLISQILGKIKEHEKPIIVRPEARKYQNYTGVNILYMNQNVASDATGIQPLNETCMRIMGLKILNDNQTSAVFIPWIEGDSYYYLDNTFYKIPTRMKYKAESFWGVGSSITAILALMAAIKADIDDTIYLSHFVGCLAAYKKPNQYLSIKDIKKALEQNEISTA